MNWRERPLWAGNGRRKQLRKRGRTVEHESNQGEIVTISAIWISGGKIGKSNQKEIEASGTNFYGLRNRQKAYLRPMNKPGRGKQSHSWNTVQMVSSTISTGLGWDLRIRNVSNYSKHPQRIPYLAGLQGYTPSSSV